MYDSSRDTLVRELTASLKNHLKQIEAIRDPGQIAGLYKAQGIARSLETDLSQLWLREFVPAELLESLLRRTSRVLALEQSIQPYQSFKALSELRLELSTLIQNLDGDPKAKPKSPWKGDRENQKTSEERKRQEAEKQKKKGSDKPNR